MHVNYISTEKGSADAPVFRNISHHLQERKAHVLYTRAMLYKLLKKMIYFLGGGKNPSNLVKLQDASSSH